MEKWEYGILEWVWDVSQVRLNLPGGQETQSRGSYAEVVTLLTTLGASGWKVAACVASSNWVMWTLQRQAEQLLRAKAPRRHQEGTDG